MTEHAGVGSLAGDVEAAVSAALATVVAPEFAGADPLVRRSEHADFQSNVAMSLAKKIRTRPADLAVTVASALSGRPPVTDATPSGPGFLNITLSGAAILARLDERAADARLGVATSEAGRRTVIDYSSPNIAKEMHVGHLRATVIGDALARVLDFLGADVVRQNHLGDWGTQFGMLIQYLDEHPETLWRNADLAGTEGGSVSVLDALYRVARAEFDSDPAFAGRARERVVALQAGDPATVASWTEIIDESELNFEQMYRLLDVLLTRADSAGESTYNDQLDDVVDELTAAGILVESKGALCVFFDDITGQDGEPLPLIVRKADGGFGYAATDLATIRHRIRDLKATRILYVVDARQALHFTMIFKVARRIGWLTDDVEAVHVPFGTVLGPDGRPFKTRAGGTVRLRDLLDSAIAAARATLLERTPDLDPATLERTATQAGIAAVKYADLSTSRTKDYVFDVDRMVSFAGNTGMYLQYAHARIRSILRRPEAVAALTGAGGPGAAGPAFDPAAAFEAPERQLALTIDEFGATVAAVGATLEPHRLCSYLYSLARTFTDFYEACPVLAADDPMVRVNRLLLCRLTGDTLARGLGLLGIAAPDRI